MEAVSKIYLKLRCYLQLPGYYLKLWRLNLDLKSVSEGACRRDSASTSGHSLRSFAEILSNPVAFDLQNFDSSAKTCVGVVFSKTKFLSVSVRNSSKDLSTSVTSQFL